MILSEFMLPSTGFKANNTCLNVIKNSFVLFKTFQSRNQLTITSKHVEQSSGDNYNKPADVFDSNIPEELVHHGGWWWRFKQNRYS